MSSLINNQLLKNNNLWAIFSATAIFLIACNKDPLPPTENRVIPEEGLLVYYPFNGNVDDASGNNLHGTYYENGTNFNQTAVYVDGVTEQALHFTPQGGGLGSYVRIPTLGIEKLSEFSIHLWVKETNMEHRTTYIQYGYSSTGAAFIGRHDNDLTFGVGTGFSVLYDSTYQNQWVFYSLNYKNGICQLFINGTSVSEQECTLNIVDTTYANIGTFGFLENGFTGDIDEVRVYNRTLSSAEMSILYSAGKGVPSPPTVTTGTASNIKAYSANFSGTVCSNGGVTVHNRGICCDTLRTPTIENTHSNNEYGNGEFTATLTNLKAGTPYYVRAYATNRVGTSYGKRKVFISAETDGGITGQPCPGVPTVTYDGYTYQTVRVGKQCWLSENLRNTHYADGTAIPLGDSTMVSNTEAYRYAYGDNSNNVEIYGYLYNLSAVLYQYPNGKDICPNGWHVPDNTELSVLKETYASKPGWLAGGDMWISPYFEYNACFDDNNCQWASNYNQNFIERNITQFSALPAGKLSSDGTTSTYGWLHYKCYLASTTLGNWGILIGCGGAIYWNGAATDNYGAIPVRCIKD